MHRHGLGATRPELNRNPNKLLQPRLPLTLASRGVTEPRVPSHPPATAEPSTPPPQPPTAAQKKQKFASPPSIMIDKKGGTHFARGLLLGEVHLMTINFTSGWICAML